MAYTQLHLCTLSGKAILYASWYQSTPPEGMTVGVPVPKADFCDVCSSVEHGSTVTLLEFDGRLAGDEVAKSLGAPWIGSKEGMRARQEARAKTRPIDEENNPVYEFGAEDGHGAAEIYVAGAKTQEEAQNIARAHFGEELSDRSFQPTRPNKEA